MFPSSGDLWIYDFIMVNGGGGEPQGVKGQRLALNLQGQEPSLGETASKSKARVPPAPGQARNSVEQG